MHKRILLPRILLLGADISDNALGRAWILADMLAEHAEVAIAGLSTRGGAWPPLAAHTGHRVEAIAAGRFPNLCGTYRLWRHVRDSDADILYVCKPRFPAMLAALLGRKGRRLALDIDDWEAGCARGGFAASPVINALAALGISFTQVADWMIPLIKARTVSNAFLQARYGGTVIPHARHAGAYGQIKDSAALRQRFGLPVTARLVMFFGTPHRHKGVDQLIEAMTLARDKGLVMVVAGMDPAMAEYEAIAQAAETALAGRYRFLPHVPWAEAPALLAAADILVVPQKNTLFTRWGQTPAKIFDAMAAGKPLVVSDIADTAAIVDGHAWLTGPDDAPAIARALDMICADWPQAQARAARLRARFLALYSYEKVGPALAEAVLGDALTAPSPDG